MLCCMILPKIEEIIQLIHSFTACQIKILTCFMLRNTPRHDFIDNLHWLSSPFFDLITKLEKKSKLNRIDENADFVMLTVRSERPDRASASKYSSHPMRANEWIAFAKTKFESKWLKCHVLKWNWPFLFTYLLHSDHSAHISWLSLLTNVSSSKDSTP